MTFVDLRKGVSMLALNYVAGIVPTLKVQTMSGDGKLAERVSAKELALSLPKHAWRTGHLARRHERLVVPGKLLLHFCSAQRL